jgi:hypothetical protein
MSPNPEPCPEDQKAPAQIEVEKKLAAMRVLAALPLKGAAK